MAGRRIEIRRYTSVFRRYTSVFRRCVLAFAAAAFAILPGCRLDMHVQPKVLPLSQSDFYEDGRGSRVPPPGAIARGQLRDDVYLYTGMSNGQPGNLMPFPATREVLERGRERFNIYCSPCHSELGDGNGMIVQRGFRRPPSFYEPRLQAAPLGHFYDVMTNGFGAMPDYAAQAPTRDRWAIAAYIRALQLSQRATPAMAPPGQPIPSRPVPVPSTAPSGATPSPGSREGGLERKP